MGLDFDRIRARAGTGTVAAVALNRSTGNGFKDSKNRGLVARQIGVEVFHELYRSSTRDGLARVFLLVFYLAEVFSNTDHLGFNLGQNLTSRARWSMHIKKGPKGESDEVWVVRIGAVIVLTVTGKLHGGGSSAVMVTVGYRSSYGRSVLKKSVRSVVA